MIRVLSLLLLLLFTHPTAASAADILWGVNGHPGRTEYNDYEKQFQIMRQNHLVTYRMDVNLTASSQEQEVAIMRKIIPLAKKYGIILRPVLLTPFRYDDRTDAGRYPAGDQQAIYQAGYTHTYDFVRLFKNDITDWEMENEINLLSTGKQTDKLSGYGWSAKEFDTPALQDWSFDLKGMSDAIAKINSEYGMHLRRLLGTTSTNFGFLDYMQSHGVNYDVISYHQYSYLREDPYKAWSRATPAYNLFAKLANLGKPIHFTEVNAAEIYKDNYLNRDDDSYSQEGTQSLQKILTGLRDQNVVKLEEIDIYELLDEPEQKDAEARFGLMYTIDRPKQALSVVSNVIAH